jgi:hypothetical protein
MFDNSMTGAVGFAIHEDRLIKATENLRLAEAEMATRRKCAAIRAALAGALVALAGRIAPATVRPATSLRAAAW